MRQIAPPIPLAQRILGSQKGKAETPYRLTTHHISLERPEGVLLYHTLTGELVLLSPEEASEVARLPGVVPPALAELVSRRFLVSDGADEMALADQVRDIARRLGGKNIPLTEYLIFTTTACNARCFYCFEAGIPKASMSEETARAAGAYIAAHCGGKPVKLVWFGGEPMLNVRAIDAISGELRRRGVQFRSRMDSNGSLFDAALAARAEADWGLDVVQITVDGTEEVYNRRKAFVNPQGSPYLRVLKNIGLLLDAGVSVRVRLNLDENNERDLYALVDELAERFGESPGFNVHCRVLIENKGVAPAAYTERQRRSLAEKVKAMCAYLDARGVAAERPLKQKLVLYSCWSDSANAATITPDGRLGRCESHIDDGIWGSVFSEERDEETLRRWRERRPAEELCRACNLYPRCVRLKKCVTRTERCSPIEREEMRLRLRQSILDAYGKWKADEAGKR